MAVIQIASNQAMSSGKFDFTDYPSQITGLEAEDNGNILPALDGEGVIQYAYQDVREFEMVFEKMLKSEHDAGDGTLIKELRDRLYKTTGNAYYLRLEPECYGAGTVSGNVLTITSVTGSISDDSLIGMDLVDAAYNAFYVTDNTTTTITVDLDGGSLTAGNFYVVSRTLNPLNYSPPMKVRINDIVAELVPNPYEAIYDYTIKFQKVT